MPIWISSRFRAADLAKLHDVDRVVSLLAPGDEFPHIDGFDDDTHLKISVDDIREDNPDQLAPQKTHVSRLLDFVDGWERETPLLVHCWAGVSRSTASAFSIACFLNPRADEFDIADTIRATSPTAQPNQLIVEHADDLLGRRGRMVEAVKSMGPAIATFEAMPFRIPSVYENGDRI